MKCHSVAGSSQPSSNRNESMGTPRFCVSSVPKALMTSQRAGLVVFAEIAQVVPRVVVQEGAIGMRPLALDVVQKAATQLAVRRSRRRRSCRSPSGRTSTAARVRSSSARAQPATAHDASGSSNPANSVPATMGDPLTVPTTCASGRFQSTSLTSRTRNICRLGQHLELLPDVVRAIAQNHLPGEMKLARLIFEFNDDSLSGNPLRQPRCIRLRVKLDNLRGTASSSLPMAGITLPSPKEQGKREWLRGESSDATSRSLNSNPSTCPPGIFQLILRTEFDTEKPSRPTSALATPGSGAK